MPGATHPEPQPAQQPVTRAAEREGDTEREAAASAARQAVTQADALLGNLGVTRLRVGSLAHLAAGQGIAVTAPGPAADPLSRAVPEPAPDGGTDVVVDPSRLTVEHAGTTVRLTPTEWQLLVTLVGAEGNPVGKPELARGVWGVSAREQEVEVYVCRLRGKLNRLGLRGGIETVRGGGYRATLAATVVRADGPARFHRAASEARRQAGTLVENLTVMESRLVALLEIRDSLRAAAHGPVAPARGPGLVRARFAPLLRQVPAATSAARTGEGTPPAPDEPTVVLDGVRLTVERGRRAVRLTPTEWQLLLALLQADGRLLDRTELAVRAWSTPVREAEVETYVCRVRRKLMQLGTLGGIETVRGAGYRATMSVAPSAVRAAPPAAARRGAG